MRKRLTIAEKLNVLEKLDANITEKDIVMAFKITRSAVQLIKRSRARLHEIAAQDNNKKRKNVHITQKFPTINEATYKWFIKMRARHIPISGPQICYAAKEFSSKMDISSFKASNGWLEKFKCTYGIKNRILCGESKSADTKGVCEFIDSFKSRSEKYNPRDIYNVDETALYYRATPNRSYVTKSDSCAGIKIDKERVTVLLGASMIGEKLKPLLIGKYRNPRCLKNINNDDLPVIYKHSKNSWMTASIFMDYMKYLNAQFKAEQRKFSLF